MKTTRILMTRSLLPVDQKYIIDGVTKLLNANTEYSFELIAPDTYDEPGILKKAASADVLLGPYVTKEILRQGVNLKLIQVPWTGMDTFDFTAVQDFNIPVCNSHSNANVVAEIAVGLLLDLLKKISYHDRKMRNGNWNRDKKPLDLSSQMVSKQIICILGYGNIGSKIGKILSSFGAKIIAVSEDAEIHPEVERMYKGQDVLAAVANCTVVINALPLTETTRGMINNDFIDAMVDHSYLVNISRAAVCVEDDIYNALLTGKLAGFASDLWWNTPKRGESLSWPSTHNHFEELEQVVMSPHRAGFVEGSLPHLDDVIENLARFIKGEELINIVDVKREF